MTRHSDNLAAARDDLSRLLATTRDGGTTRTVLDVALNRMDAANPAYPAAARYDRDGGKATPDGSPPPPGALIRDPGARDLKAVRELVARIRRDADLLAGMTAAWLPHEPDAVARRKAEQDNTHRTDDGCRLHALIDKHEARARGDLCWWCYDFGRRNGREPNTAEVQRNAAGLVVRVKA